MLSVLVFLGIVVVAWFVASATFLVLGMTNMDNLFGALFSAAFAFFAVTVAGVWWLL